MRILIITTHYNNPEFIRLQNESFNYFVCDGGHMDFVVSDDSTPEVISLVDGKSIGNKIKEECDKFGLKCVKIPQSIHQNISKGGLVPDGLPTNHPTERHRATLHYILQNLDQFTHSYDEYDMLVITESDALIRKDVFLFDFIKDYDIIGTGRRTTVHKTNDPDQYWLPELGDAASVDIDFFTMYLLMVNLKTVKNINQLDIGGFGGTDTGGKSFLFLKQNPEYRYKLMSISGNKEYQLDFFHNNSDSEENAEFVHYRGGSNWDHQSIDYYKEKLNRMLKTFVPQLYKGQQTHQQNLTSRDGEHTFKTD